MKETVGFIGLGGMGMSDFYDPKHLNDQESIRVIPRYIDAGGNFLDTADMYGVGRNEALVDKAIRGRRNGVVVATKFGNVRGTNGEYLGVRGDPPYVPQGVDQPCLSIRATSHEKGALPCSRQRMIFPRQPESRRSSYSTLGWPTARTCKRRPSRPTGTSRGRISSPCTSCSTRSTRTWRTTWTTSPSGRCSSAAWPKAQPGWWRSAAL